LFEKIA
jgi:hypothetical protein